MPRGTIVDRNGLALATGQPALAEATIERLRKLRIDRVADCLPGTALLSARRTGVSRHRRSRAPDQLGRAQRLLRRARRQCDAAGIRRPRSHRGRAAARRQDPHAHRPRLHRAAAAHAAQARSFTRRGPADAGQAARRAPDTGWSAAGHGRAGAQSAGRLRPRARWRGGRGRRGHRSGARFGQLSVAGARRIGRGWPAGARRAPRSRALRPVSARLDVQADCRGSGADRRRGRANADLRLRAAAGRTRRRARPRRVASDPRRPDRQDAARPGGSAQGTRRLVQRLLRATGDAPRAAGDQPRRGAAADSGLLDAGEFARHAAVRRLRSGRSARQPAAHGARRGGHCRQRRHPRSCARAARREDHGDESAVAARTPMPPSCAAPCAKW